MYCRNCGKEIEDGVTFCSECGLKIESEYHQKAAVPKPAVKKWMRLLLPCVAIIVVVLAGIKNFSYNRSKPSLEEIQTAANNLQNGSLVASDGTWIYYNDGGLCKMRLKDGSERSVISSAIYAEHMFYIGDSLYYYSFPDRYYVLDGTTGKDLGFGSFDEKRIQSDGSKFYVSGTNYMDGGVYSTEVGNTQNGTKLSDIEPTELFLQGDYLYVVSAYHLINDLPNENRGVWRMSKDGKDPIHLFDYCPAYHVFSGEKIYYTNESHTVCSANLDGSDETVFEGAVAGGGLNVSENYIFYICSDTRTIYRMDKDGKNKLELNSDRSGKLNIIEDWIFYENRDDHSMIYKMSFDGSYNQPIY